MGVKNLVSDLAWGLGALLPLRKNRVVFSSYYGRGYSDSPRAIAQALLDTGEDLDLLWLVSSPEEAATLPQGIRPVDYRGWGRILALSTAKVWVDNCRKYDRRKRKGQYYMQTWHGFALKRIEADAAEALEPEYVRGCRLDSAHCDLMVAGSRFMEELYHRSFWYSGPVALYGSPRNDVFFRPQEETARAIRRFFGLPEDRKLVLYAPTFRADHSTAAYGLAPEPLLEALGKRFGGDWSLLVRLHPNVTAQSAGLFAYDGDRVLDATKYPEMAELLCAADVLLTDYSSCMFDFALSGKPCLQFATDIETYRNDRNFYFPLDELPFPLAQSNEALARAVETFDGEAYACRWKSFTEENGFREDGHAAERCADWIIDKLNEKGRA